MNQEAGRAPVTRAAVRHKLRELGLSPLHRYGQHFLIRPGALETLVELAGVRQGDVVLEVGPGLGGLTERLLGRGAQVVAVEVDRGLAAWLQTLFHGEARLHLVHGDVMGPGRTLAPAVAETLRRVCGFGGFKVAANLPYQVSSPFVAALLTGGRPAFHRAVLTLQKEVARVLRAGPGDPDYSSLSLLARLCLQVGRGPTFGPGDFHPPPRVTSEVVVLEPAPGGGILPRPLAEAARRLFQGRRKALRRTLGRMLREAGAGGVPEAEGALEAAGLDPGARVDAVAPERLIEALRRSGLVRDEGDGSG